MSSFTLLIDDQDSQINYLCPTLHQKVTGSYSNRTWSTIEDRSCGDGWFQYTFYGTGIRINIPTRHSSQDVSVTLDNTPLAPLPDGSFESSALLDGPHTLKYASGNVKLTPVFDYLTVTAGPSTQLNGRTLVVDDADLVFSGSWSSAPPDAVRNYDYSTSLYRDTLRWSSTVGDTMDFEFTGTSVSVYGLAFNVTSATRNLTATYTLDGVTQTLRVPEETFDSLPMTEFFHASDLAGGRHTLRVNLTDVAYPQAYGIDFVSYNSSVNSITTLPEYSPSANASPIRSDGKSGLNVGEIIGIALGSVAFLALLLVGFLFWRRSRQASSKKPPVPVLSSNNSSYDDIEASKREAQHQGF